MNGKKIKTTLLIAVFILSTLAVSISVSAAPPLPLTVGPGKTYATITLALAAANPGDVIEVYAETYVEDLSIVDADLVLMAAAGEAVILQGTSSSTFPAATVNLFIDADNVTVQGFTIKSAPLTNSTPYATPIHVHGTNAKIFDNEFLLQPASDIQYAELVAIAVTGTVDISGLNISGNVFDATYTDNAGDDWIEGIFVNPGGGTGVVTIEDNIFQGGLFRAIATERDKTGIAGNTITSDLPAGTAGYGGFAAQGILVLGTSTGYVDIIDNDVSGYHSGIVTSSTQLYIYVEENSIHSNEIGIWAKTSNYRVYVRNNTIFDNIQYGLLNDDTERVYAEWNWWGHDTGPSGQGSGDGDAVYALDSDDIRYDPWIGMCELEITPESVQGEYEGWFDFTIKNTGSNPSFYYLYMWWDWDGFELIDCNAAPGWMIYGVYSDSAEFYATGGYETELGEETTFRLKLRAPDVTDLYEFDFYGYNARDEDFKMYYDELNPTIAVDADAPVVTVDHPIGVELTDGYSAGSGDKIWINATIFDEFDVTPTLYINATFAYMLSSPTAVTGGYEWTASFYNTAPIPDGPLKFFVNATDAAGNEGTSGTIEVEIDTTPPDIIIIVYDSTEELPEPAPGVFYIGTGETQIWVNVTVYEPHLDEAASKVYLNTTLGYLLTSVTNNTKQGPFTIGTADYLVINITTFDTASPEANNYNKTVEVCRDLVPPYNLGFDEVEAIPGGLIVRGLHADDIVGVLNYVISVNGSVHTTITAEALLPVEVLDLASYAGEPVNITVFANDYGLNPTDEIILYVGMIPEGDWLTIELFEGWNLISLPRIPDDPSIETVLSWIVADVESVWGAYDTATGAWLSYAPDAPSDLEEMVDGEGYWVKMTDSAMLVVIGRELPEPPYLPPAYDVVPGWNLIGFKETYTMPAEDYLGTDVSASCRRIYAFYDGAYHAVALSDPMEPGLGYWIAVTEAGTIYP